MRADDTRQLTAAVTQRACAARPGARGRARAPRSRLARAMRFAAPSSELAHTSGMILLLLVHASVASGLASSPLPPASCNLMVGHDLICHNITRGGKGPQGHYAVWCDDLVQLPCTSTADAPCDACASPHGCHALCLKNHTGGGACTAWSYNHQHKLCYLKGLADFPANETYKHFTGKPATSADTSGHLWNHTVLDATWH